MIIIARTTVKPRPLGRGESFFSFSWYSDWSV